MDFDKNDTEAAYEITLRALQAVMLDLGATSQQIHAAQYARDAVVLDHAKANLDDVQDRVALLHSLEQHLKNVSDEILQNPIGAAEILDDAEDAVANAVGRPRPGRT